LFVTCLSPYATPSGHGFADVFELLLAENVLCHIQQLPVFVIDMFAVGGTELFNVRFELDVFSQRCRLVEVLQQLFPQLCQ